MLFQGSCTWCQLVGRFLLFCREGSARCSGLAPVCRSLHATYSGWHLSAAVACHLQRLAPVCHHCMPRTVDTKLTFKNHVRYLRSSCQKALDILRVVRHTDWGADRIVLLRLYRAVVRSKLDYGCVCLWIGPSVGSKAIGSDPPSGLAYRFGGFSHISCPESQRGSARTFLNLSPSKTCYQLCSETEMFAGKSSLQLRF